jgi:thiol-disulfide isomerase/thioredoxin
MTEPVESPSRSTALIMIFLIALFGVVGAVLVIAANGGLGSSAPSTPLPMTQAVSRLAGRAAPNFELPTLDGGTTRLSSLRGRIVFLNFWATWCEPCKRELPAFQRFMAQQKDEGPVILAVNIGETPELISGFLEDHGISGIPIALDSEFTVETAYSVEFYPTTYVIDPAGIVYDVHLGEMKVEDLNNYVQRLTSAS